MLDVVHFIADLMLSKWESTARGGLPGGVWMSSSLTRKEHKHTESIHDTTLLRGYGLCLCLVFPYTFCLLLVLICEPKCQAHWAEEIAHTHR